MAHFQYLLIIQVLLYNTKHLLTSVRAKCRWLLLYCVGISVRVPGNSLHRVRHSLLPLFALRL
jgi:hypothetical protein